VLVGTGVADLDAEARQLLVEEALGPAVDPARGDEVIAGAEHGDVGERGRRHAAGDEDRVFRLLERGVLLRDRDLSRGVAVAGVEDRLVGADGIDEGGALDEGRSDRRPVGPAVEDSVDRGGGASQPAAHRRVTG
jgi:hypothetical protein